MRRLILIAATWAVLVGVYTVNAAAQPAPAGTRFTLTGVVFVEGGPGRAWLQEPTLTRNEVVSVRPGDSVGAYRLTKVLEDRVEMEGPTGKFSIPLAGAPSSAPAAVAATPAPAPAPMPVTNYNAPPPPLTPEQQESIRRKHETPGTVSDFAAVIRSLAGGQ